MPDYDQLIGAFREDTLVARPAPRRSAAPWWAGGLVVGLAAAITLVVAWPRPLDGPLVSGPVTDEVVVVVDGTGQVAGTRHDLNLAWAAGTLGVEVTPERGVQLAVRTEEATVEVVGTGFDVVRDALGTAVTVRHGRVRVRCATGGETELAKGEHGVCLPVSAAGRLGRLRALQERGQPYAGEIDAALALADATGIVRAEILAVRLDALLADGDPAALPLAETLAAEGGPRALYAHRVAARLAPDCAAALPHLRVLAAAEALGEDAAAWSRCGGGGAAP